MVAIHENTWMPEGIDTAMLAAEKNARLSPGMPVVNMWWTHRPKLKKPVAIKRDDDQPVADQRRLGHGRDHHRNQACGRQEDDVDLGVAEEPEQMLPEQRIAALRRR